MPPPSTPSCLQNTADENMILIKPDWTSGYAYGTSYMWFLNYRCGEGGGGPAGGVVRHLLHVVPQLQVWGGKGGDLQASLRVTLWSIRNPCGRLILILIRGSSAL